MVKLVLRYGYTRVRSSHQLKNVITLKLKGEFEMLVPKRVKHRKVSRGRMTGKAIKGSQLVLGEYGLQALEPGWITNVQIEAARIALTRHIKRGGKVWIKIFPDKPVTAK